MSSAASAADEVGCDSGTHRFYEGPSSCGPDWDALLDGAGSYRRRGDTGRPFATVGVAKFFSRAFAYFPRSGQAARISVNLADALLLHSYGAPWRVAREMLVARHGRAGTRSAIQQVRALRRSGLLDPDKPDDGHRHRDRWVSTLLATRPRKRMLLVTEACNLACTYCYEVANGFHNSARMMSPACAAKHVEELVSGSEGRRSFTITFFGGEPLLNGPAIREAVATARRLERERSISFTFCITTNLLKATDEDMDFLVAERFAVMVSLDGDETSNDSARKDLGGKGTYRRVVGNLQRLLAKQTAAGVRVARIRGTLSRGNPDYVTASRNLRELGTPLVTLGEACGTVEGRGADDMTHEQVVRNVNNMTGLFEGYLRDLENAGADDSSRAPAYLEAAISENVMRVHDVVLVGEQAPRTEIGICGVCRNMKASTPSGAEYPCHRYAGMPNYRLDLAPGATDAYYRQIWDSFEAKCRGCWARVLCGGQCAWHLSRADGTLASPDEDSCQFIRFNRLRALALHATLMEEHPKIFRRFVDRGAVS